LPAFFVGRLAGGAAGSSGFVEIFRRAQEIREAAAQSTRQGEVFLVYLQKRSFERRAQFSIANVKGQPRDLLAQLNLLGMWSAKAAATRSVAQAKTAPVLQNG